MRSAAIVSAFATAVLIAGAALAPGCFSPSQPPCAFTCVVAPFACPTGFTCGADGICLNDKNPGECLFTGQDAASDGGSEGDGTGTER